MSRGTKLAHLADFIKSEACQSICILTGAGVSVASGIPDFRSPGGMYDTLKPELLTASENDRKQMALNPTHVVSWSLFQENQLPYLELRRPFMLGILDQQSSSNTNSANSDSQWATATLSSMGSEGTNITTNGIGSGSTSTTKWRATLGHFFARLLEDKGKLTRLYTQNIDGLDFQVGLPDEKIVNVHGSIGKVACEFCKESYPNDEWCGMLRERIKSRGG